MGRPISLDLDGVLCDFWHGTVTVANCVFPDSLPKGFLPFNYSPWDHDEVFSSEDWEKIWQEIRNTPDFWYLLPQVNNNARELSGWLRQRPGKKVYFITSRIDTIGDDALQQTRDWLHLYDLSDITARNPQIIRVDKARDKAGHIRRLDIAFSLDDYASTVEQCNLVPGHRAFLYTAPYNKYSTEPRVGSLSEFLRIVEQEPIQW